MVVPQACPICFRSEIQPLFDKPVGISVNFEGILRNVGGFTPFMCSINGHIFLVRNSDLDPR